MKRKGFIQACLATGVVMASPFATLAKTLKNYRFKTGFKVDNGKARDGKILSPFKGDTFTGKITTEDSEGDIYVFESSRVEEGGPAHHYHFTQDEWWYVLKGKFLIKVGDVTYQCEAGDSVFGPRMVPHSFAKVGEEEGKLLMVFQPAGKMESFFTKLSEGAGKNMTEAERDKFTEEHGFKRVGPPITKWKKW